MLLPVVDLSLPILVSMQSSGNFPRRSFLWKSFPFSGLQEFTWCELPAVRSPALTVPSSPISTSLTSVGHFHSDDSLPCPVGMLIFLLTIALHLSRPEQVSLPSFSQHHLYPFNVKLRIVVALSLFSQAPQFRQAFPFQPILSAKTRIQAFILSHLNRCHRLRLSPRLLISPAYHCHLILFNITFVRSLP